MNSKTLEITINSDLTISSQVLHQTPETNHYQCRHCGSIFHYQIVCPSCQCLTQPYSPTVNLDTSEQYILSEILDKALPLWYTPCRVKDSQAKLNKEKIILDQDYLINLKGNAQPRRAPDRGGGRRGRWGRRRCAASGRPRG